MGLEQFKQAQQQAWEDGDYRPVGRMLAPAAHALVDRAGVAPGDRVLDVATGSGNVAIEAARSGAEVVGIDHTDAWFDEARRRAGEADVSLTLQVGDAEDLPVDDHAFDIVLSGFGAIFAPRHEVVAAELVRVCRPGGTIGLTAWPREGANARTFAALTEHLPEPPAFGAPSIDWGDPEHVRKLFAPHEVSLQFETRTLPVAFTSTDEFEDFVFENSGPLMAARRMLEDTGRWDEAHTAWRAAVAEANEATDGTYRAMWEYLLVLGTTSD